MHRARHTAHSSAFRPRLLIALVVAAVGLAFALWLPARNDNASATENGRDPGQSQGDHRRDHDRDHRRDRDRESPSASPSPSSSDASPSPSPSASDPTESASPSESPSPSETPTSEAPKATEWAPFTDYVAGQLVKFKGVEYQVQQTHTSLPGWEPTALPTLFKAVD
jgi:cytoskeletal protein RodZ